MQQLILCMSEEYMFITCVYKKEGETLLYTQQKQSA